LTVVRRALAISASLVQVADERGLVTGECYDISQKRIEGQPIMHVMTQAVCTKPAQQVYQAKPAKTNNFVCGRASVSQRRHPVGFEFCVGYCQEPGIHSRLELRFCGVARADRPRYYCGGDSTVVTTPHESDGFHMSYARETYVDIKANAAILFSRSLLS
jgi:hypothetical protein